MNRMIPKKNYVILGIIIVVTLLLMKYLYMWYDAYLDNKLNKPILDKYMEIINYNELDDYLVESPNAIIYVSVLENDDIRNFEKKFKGLFKNHVINRDILYMDITDDEENINLIVNKYSNGSVNNVEVPTILVIEGGVLKSVYNIKENNYDVGLVKLFIDSIKFLEEDELDG